MDTEIRKTGEEFDLRVKVVDMTPKCSYSIPEWGNVNHTAKIAWGQTSSMALIDIGKGQEALQTRQWQMNRMMRVKEPSR